MLVRCAAAAISPSMCLSHYGSITNCIQNSSIVRIFRDSLIVPNVFLEVICPRSTGASVEPWGSRNLACSSYGKLRYLRSSSAFPVIGRFVVENETATNTTMTMITGADSAAAYGAMISKRARLVTAREWILIFGNCSADLCLAGIHSFPCPLISDCATAIGTRRRCPRLNGLPALASDFVSEYKLIH